MKMTAQCPAKINLTLDIVGVRSNGYHDIETIMQSVSIYDTVTLNVHGKGGILIKCDRAHVPTNSRNVAYKAAENFFRFTGTQNTGISIEILKRIPVAAGLAGGSTDAAGVILMLNSLMKTSLSFNQLAKIGLSVGTDVPFCMFGNTALATGLGEVLTPIPRMPECVIVLAKPVAPLSTKIVYNEYDKNTSELHPYTKEVLDSLEKGDLSGICNRMYNVLEATAKRLCPDIISAQRIIKEFSPRGVCMSGSGPTSFAVFESREQGEKCRVQLLKAGIEAHIVTPVKKVLLS